VDNLNDDQQHIYDKDEVEDALFETSDQALEEMLAADLMDPGDPPAPKRTLKKEEQEQEQIQKQEQKQEQEQEIKALLERLSASVPTDTCSDDDDDHHPDSDTETTNSQSSALVAQYKDEAQVDLLHGTTSPPPDAVQGPGPGPGPGQIELPSAPETETSTSSTAIADLTARMAALRNSPDRSELLPSVPTSQPSKPSKSVLRLTSKTAYTDDDMDSWCTVCLEDATLRCQGCDGDVYCTRCWREMHLGPAAHFDDVSHRAVQFSARDRRAVEDKIALGA